ncbi:yippee-like protein [Populus alba x Populus x berolinensis]|nr:yippee-like protein [Populus alba x Populus x berolinensis]
MGRLYIETVQNSGGEGGEGRVRKIFKCKWCKVEFASYYDILSKEFQGRFGRAYLFRNVVNISLGPSEERLLVSGWHTTDGLGQIYSHIPLDLSWKLNGRFVWVVLLWIPNPFVRAAYRLSQHLGFPYREEEDAQEKAYEESQKYKEGMYILEKERMLKEG